MGELDQYGHNFILDELVWHLEEGRVPVSISMDRQLGRIGVMFHFEAGGSAFLMVPELALDEHWREAQNVSRKLKELRHLRYEPS